MQETGRIFSKGARALAWAVTRKASKRLQQSKRFNGFGAGIHSAIEKKAEGARIEFTRAWFKIKPAHEGCQGNEPRKG